MSQKTNKANKKFAAGKKNDNAKEKKPLVPGEWLYMSTKELNVQDIRRAFDTENGYDIELWEEAGVLEIGWGEKNSFDMEAAEIHPKDEITSAFANERKVKGVFLVTFKAEEYEEAKKIMRIICDACGGFFCGDTEDFIPVYPE